MTIGKKIQQARKAAGFSQKQLAEKLGVSASMIGQYENDLRKPKFETIIRIVDALDISESEFLPDDYQEALTYMWRVGWLAKDEEYRIAGGYSFTENEVRLIECFNKLNNEGQSKAVERVEELTEIPKYQKEPPHD